MVCNHFVLRTYFYVRYHWNDDEQQWYWSPDRDQHMPCFSNVVTGGQWEGEIPAPENVEIIAYLDTIRPVPSDEQYIPSLEFDVLTLLQSLSLCSDRTVCDNVLGVVKIWKDAGVLCVSSSKHVQSWRRALDNLLMLKEYN